MLRKQMIRLIVNLWKLSRRLAEYGGRRQRRTIIEDIEKRLLWGVRENAILREEIQYLRSANAELQKHKLMLLGQLRIEKRKRIPTIHFVMSPKGKLFRYSRN